MSTPVPFGPLVLARMSKPAGAVRTSGPGMDVDAGAVRTSGPGTDDVDSDDDVFEGASSATQSGLGDGYECDMCHRTFHNQSALAYFTEKDEFAKRANAEVHQIIQQARKDNGEGYQNFSDLGMVVRQICTVCGEDLHDQKGEYVLWKPHPTQGWIPVRRRLECTRQWQQPATSSSPLRAAIHRTP